jgi:hypothetical protein
MPEKNQLANCIYDMAENADHRPQVDIFDHFVRRRNILL